MHGFVLQVCRTHMPSPMCEARAASLRRLAAGGRAVASRLRLVLALALRLALQLQGRVHFSASDLGAAVAEQRQYILKWMASGAERTGVRCLCSSLRCSKQHLHARSRRSPACAEGQRTGTRAGMMGWQWLKARIEYSEAPRARLRGGGVWHHSKKQMKL